MGKEENGGYQHFLLFTECFQTCFLLRVVKTLNFVIKGNCFGKKTSTTKEGN